MLFLVECISCIAPCLRLHFHGNSILGHYFQNIVFLIYVDDASQSAVDPPLLHIVFHEDDLCALLQFQMQECGERCFRKLPLDTPIKEDRWCGELTELVLVDVVHVVPPCGQHDVIVGDIFSRILSLIGRITRIEQLQFCIRHLILSDMVQGIDKGQFALAIHFAQLYTDQIHLTEHTS